MLLDRESLRFDTYPIDSFHPKRYSTEQLIRIMNVVDKIFMDCRQNLPVLNCSVEQ